MSEEEKPVHPLEVFLAKLQRGSSITVNRIFRAPLCNIIKIDIDAKDRGLDGAWAQIVNAFLEARKHDPSYKGSHE